MSRRARYYAWDGLVALTALVAAVLAFVAGGVFQGITSLVLVTVIVLGAVERRAAWRQGWTEGFASAISPALLLTAETRQTVTGNPVPEPWEAVGLNGLELHRHKEGGQQ